MFTVVKEKFESISQWGEDGILIYEADDMHSFPAIKLKAWRPDYKTTGLNQYAEKSFNYGSDYGFGLFYMTGEIQKKGNYLKIFPRLNGGAIAISCLLGIVSFAFSYFVYLAFKLD